MEIHLHVFHPINARQPTTEFRSGFRIDSGVLYFKLRALVCVNSIIAHMESRMQTAGNVANVINGCWLWWCNIRVEISLSVC